VVYVAVCHESATRFVLPRGQRRRDVGRAAGVGVLRAQFLEIFPGGSSTRALCGQSASVGVYALQEYLLLLLLSRRDVPGRSNPASLRQLPERVLGIRPAFILVVAAAVIFVVCYPRMAHLDAPWDC